MNARLLFSRLLFGGTIIAMSALAACGDDDSPQVDPIVGEWEMDDASLVFSGYSYYGFDNENDVYGESSYIITFNSDFTYEREINDIPLNGGGTDDHSDEGEWEKDDDDLDLDSEDDEVSGVPYSFTIVELEDDNLVLEYEITNSLFPDTKIEEWFADGTINSNGQFDVTDDEFDSLVVNFSQQATGVVTLEFEKQ